MSYDIENTPNIRKTFEIEFKKKRKIFFDGGSSEEVPKVQYPQYNKIQVQWTI